MHEMRSWVRLFEAEEIEEKSPPGWEGTVKGLKKHKEIDNPWALCLAGDTKVPLLDGRTLSMEQLVEEYGDGTPFWVYSFDTDYIRTSTNKKHRRNGFFVPGLAHHPRCTGTQQTLRVTLDNGETIICSRGHPFLMRDNTYKVAQNLAIGDALRPLNFRLNEKGYREFDCGYDQWHVLHWHQQCVANGHKSAGAGTAALVAYNKSDVGREHARKNLLTYNASDQHREAVRERMKHSPDHVRKLHEGARRPEVRKRQAVSMSEWHKANPQVSRATMEVMRNAQTTEQLSANAKWGSHLRWHERRGTTKPGCSFCEAYSNHKVLSIEAGPEIPVYDLTVETYHNFALEAGVFVHNSWYMKNKGFKSHRTKSGKKKRS
jgi:hypothetical protein